MTGEAALSEREIFKFAVQLPAQQRPAYLDQACGDNRELREEVESLVNAHDSSNSFMERPALELPADGFGGTTNVVPLAERPGTIIGSYKLLEQIGEGGFGVVFSAEQERPVRRRVALKIIKPGMDTQQVIARFEAERQALAMMDHSNIAKVHDTGATENGRPYFVMELVQGVPITDYCDQCHLTTRERLALFITICQAVQHAHQKGVIHRDIKPTNVLVAIQDGQPAPRIIDFGVAKAINQRLTEHTLATGFAQIVGTPLYMSPEQAELSPLGVDTRSDIYSLGVLLYELLTSTTPFDKDRLHEASYDEMRRIIREEEPPRPSARISTLAADLATTVAGHRRTDARRLLHTVRGELDWIVMKCLDKDRTRRYETVNALTMDVQRHLDNEPILARSPTNVYRFQKMVRRNKLAFAAASAVLAALVLGLGASTWMFVKERAAHQRAVAAEREQTRMRLQAETARANEARLRQQAQVEEQKAKTEAAKSEQLAAYMSSVALAVGEGRLEEAQQLVTEMPTPRWERDPKSADWLRFRGDLRARAGHWKEAAEDFSKVIEFEPEGHLDYHLLAPLLVQSGDLEAYRRLRTRILARFSNTTDPGIAERMVKDCLILPAPEAELDNLAQMADTALAAGPNHPVAPFFHFAKGLSEFRQGRFTSAAEWMQKVLNKSEEFEFRDAQAYMVLAMSHQQLNQPNEARAALAKGSEIAKVSLSKLESGDIGTYWFDWIIVQALEREAKALIEGQLPLSPASAKEL